MKMITSGAYSTTQRGRHRVRYHVVITNGRPVRDDWVSCCCASEWIRKKREKGDTLVSRAACTSWLMATRLSLKDRATLRVRGGNLPSVGWIYRWRKTVGDRNSWPSFCQILTDLENFSTGRFPGKFAVNWLKAIPPLLAYVATLPCKTLMS